MDRLIVERKLDSLRRCLVRIAGKCPPTVEQLEAVGRAMPAIAGAVHRRARGVCLWERTAGAR